MKSKSSVVAWVVAVVVIILIIIGAWYWRNGANVSKSVPAPAQSASVASAASVAAVHHPIAEASAPAPASTAPLPALADSDAGVRAALARLGGGDASVGNLLANRHIVQRIVAMVDALPRHEMGRNILPLKPPAGTLATSVVDGELVLDQADFARYAPYMQWVEQADVKSWVGWYVHAYPLFQQAYRNLGYPEGYFNDRLVTVIDDLLKAPEPRGPIALTRTDKGYAFADPRLENLSVGQKMMLRVGPTNEARIKQKLRAIRTAVTGANGPAATASSD